MKKTILFTIMLVLMATTAIASSSRWTVKETTTEMGEKIITAMVASKSSTNTVFALGNKIGGGAFFALYSFDIDLNFGSNSLDFRIDDNEMIQLPAAYESGDDYDYMYLNLNQKLLNQIMRGDVLKIRFDTLSKGYIVHEYTLNNSANAISKALNSGI